MLVCLCHVLLVYLGYIYIQWCQVQHIYYTYDTRAYNIDTILMLHLRVHYICYIQVKSYIITKSYIMHFIHFIHIGSITIESLIESKQYTLSDLIFEQMKRSTGVIDEYIVTRMTHNYDRLVRSIHCIYYLRLINIYVLYYIYTLNVYSTYVLYNTSIYTCTLRISYNIVILIIYSN